MAHNSAGEVSAQHLNSSEPWSPSHEAVAAAGSGAAQLPSSGTDLYSGIDAALLRSDAESARQLAEALLRSGAAGLQPPLEAGALLRLAYCDLALSRVQRALEGARRAAALFKDAGLGIEEVDALALWSRSAAHLGRSIEAVEVALLAVRLAAGLQPGPWTARAQLSLAVAFGRGHASSQAEAAFEAARQAANLYANTAGRLEVAVDRLWVQLMRRDVDSRGAEPEARLRVASDVLALLSGWKGEADSLPLTPGSSASLRASAALACGLASLWAGKREEATTWLGRADFDPGTPMVAGWLLAAQSWLQAELAIEAGALEMAAMHASSMTHWALELQNRPLASLGSGLTVEVYLKQGRADLAVVEQSRQLTLERSMQAHHLDGRDEVAAVLWTARQSEHRIKDLAAEASKFEEWALQDALTGIANRRRFNQCLEAWSTQAPDVGEPLCTALIDVDRFKRINDDFSHDVGDDVLTAIGRTMAAHVREGDLAARWGGDEFAILFRNTDIDTARQISERIQQAVQNHDWETVAPNLAVTVSVGVVEAQPGDNMRSLSGRVDKAMFSNKRGGRQSKLARTMPPALLQRVTGWLRRAERVTIFVGSGTSDTDKVSPRSESFGALGL
jgi:diguanylate cyclase (GGDEF)-like protein